MPIDSKTRENKKERLIVNRNMNSPIRSGLGFEKRELNDFMNEKSSSKPLRNIK